MHKSAIVAFGIVLTTVSASARPDENPTRSAQVVLRDASVIARQHGLSKVYPLDTALLDIGRLQVEIGDFDAALQSFRASSYEYGQESGFRMLAKALAHSGKLDHALDVVRLIDASGGCGPSDDNDVVRLAWAEHHIELGNFGFAGNAINDIDSSYYKAIGLSKLAAGYARSGDKLQAKTHFAKSIETAARVSDCARRTEVIVGVAKSQIATGDKITAVTTLNNLVTNMVFKDRSDEVMAYCEAALVFSSLNDTSGSRNLFQRAVDASKGIEKYRSHAYMHIAVAQIRAGFLEDAQKTSKLLDTDAQPDASGREWERILPAIAMQKLDLGDISGGVHTALPIEYEEDHDGVLAKAVDLLLARRELKSALALTSKFKNSSKVAVAKLKIATAYAKAGKHNTALTIARNIHFNRQNMLLNTTDFDYRQPATWMEHESVFTMAIYARSVKRAVDVASAAAEFVEVIGSPNTQPYSVLLAEVPQEEIVRSVARSQSRLGGPTRPLEWVRKLKPSNRASESNSNENMLKRVHGLIGVAEGILDRTNVLLQEGLAEKVSPSLLVD